jgi:hypothetical protein
MEVGGGATSSRRRWLAVCGTGLLALAGVLVLVSFPAMLELSCKVQKSRNSQGVCREVFLLGGRGVCGFAGSGGGQGGWGGGGGWAGSATPTMDAHADRCAFCKSPCPRCKLQVSELTLTMWMCGICFFSLQATSAVPGLGLGEGRGATAAELEGGGAGGNQMVSAQDYGKVLAKITGRLAKDTAKIDSLETKVDDAEETNEELSAKYKAIFKAKVRRGDGRLHTTCPVHKHTHTHTHTHNLSLCLSPPPPQISICPRIRLRFGQKHTPFSHFFLLDKRRLIPDPSLFGFCSSRAQGRAGHPRPERAQGTEGEAWLSWRRWGEGGEGKARRVDRGTAWTAREGRNARKEVQNPPCPQLFTQNTNGLVTHSSQTQN